MCFSAPASIASGAALAAGGAVTVKQVKTPSELPYALLPALFAVQQFIEGGIWLSITGEPATSPLIYAYSMFAYALWPIFVPLAILLLEKDKFRRGLIGVFWGLGIFIGLIHAYFYTVSPISASVIDHSIVYQGDFYFRNTMAILYVLVTCGSAIASGHKMVNFFGIGLFASFLVTAIFFYGSFVSMWCFFAAILSLIVYLHFRYRK